MSGSSPQHSPHAQAIKTLREWDFLGTANHLYYEQAIDSLEEQYEGVRSELELSSQEIDHRDGEILVLHEQLDSLHAAATAYLRAKDDRTPITGEGWHKRHDVNKSERALRDALNPASEPREKRT